ncbi:MAG: arsenite efflux transporter metallochaperone ArsD [Nitrosomonas ureae]
MATIHVFDPASCCSSDACGSDAAQELTAFSADVDWVKQRDVAIERFNLAQQPMAFTDNSTVKGFLERSGEDALPLILVDGEVALAGRYPHRSELARWAGIPLQEEVEESSCCGGCC